MLDGAPDAVKVACPVLAGGKAGDNIKGLPIGTFRSNLIPYTMPVSKNADFFRL